MRRIRGALGVGLTWGIGWGLVMAALGTAIGVIDPDQIDRGEEPWRLGLMVGTVGFFSGVACATLFSWLENRKTVRELSVGRAALWGAVGGAVLPLLTSMNDSVLYNTMPLGAIFAASTVAIARRTALREADAVERLPSESDVPRVGA